MNTIKSKLTHHLLAYCTYVSLHKCNVLNTDESHYEVVINFEYIFPRRTV